MSEAADILKAMQLVIKSIITDATRLTHNMEAFSANLGYVIELLEKSSN